jgi:hypothetical protein
MIVWRAGQYSTHSGYVGKIELFSVFWASTRDSSGDMWELRPLLPGFTHAAHGKRFPTADEAKVEAERIMAKFVAYIQTNWKSESP